MRVEWAALSLPADPTQLHAPSIHLRPVTRPVPHPFRAFCGMGGMPQKPGAPSIRLRPFASVGPGASSTARRQKYGSPQPIAPQGGYSSLLAAQGMGRKAPEGASFQRGQASIVLRVLAFLSNLRCSYPSSTTIVVSTVSWIGLRRQCRPVRKSCEPVRTGRGALPTSSSIALAGC